MLVAVCVWTPRTITAGYNMSGAYLSRCTSLCPTFVCSSLVETSGFCSTHPVSAEGPSCRLTGLFTLRALQVGWLICRCDDVVCLLISACELRTLSSSAPPSNSCFLSCLSACCCRSLKEREQRRGLERFFCKNSDSNPEAMQVQ